MKKRKTRAKKGAQNVQKCRVRLMNITLYIFTCAVNLLETCTTICRRQRMVSSFSLLTQWRRYLAINAP
jgi:hypothetical protein